MQKNWGKLLLLSVTALTVSAQSIKEQAKQLGIDDLNLHIGSKFANLQGSPDRATKYSLTAALESKITLTNDLKFLSYVGFRYETGSSRVDFNEKRYTPSSKLVYDYAYMNYNLFDIIDLQAGALDNTDSRATSSLVNSYVSFLGVRQRIKVGVGPLKLDLIATQAMPYNDDLNDNFGVVEEGTPKFYSEIANIGLDIKGAKLNAKVGHYAYEQLSSSVAYNDRYYGNSVTGSDEFNSSYDYNFKGWIYGGSADFSITNYLNVRPEFEMVKNDEADQGKNEGRYTTIRFESEIRDHKVFMTLGNFAVESDTAPSFYNKSIYKNDYEGNFVTFKIENPEDLTTTIKFTDRKAQNTKAGSDRYLQDEKVYSISLRKSYDIF